MYRKLDSITAAKLKIAKELPYLGPTLQTHNIFLDEKCKEETGHLGYNDGRFNIGLDPDYFESLSQAERAGLILHEIYHKFRGHFYRMGKRDRDLWNQAADYQINSDIKKLQPSGIDISKFWLYDPKYEDMSVEGIYHRLLAENPTSGVNMQGDGDGQGGGSKGIPGMSPIKDVSEIDADEVPKFQQANEKARERALAFGKQAGTMPGFLEQQIEAERATSLPWHEIVRNKLVKSHTGSPTYRRINNRRSTATILRPIRRQVVPGTVDVIVDTSGSVIHIFGKLLGIMSEVTMNMRQMVRIISVDTAVRKIEEFPAGCPVEDFELKGGGGTSFAPGFDVVSPATDTVIYLTDGYCGTYPDYIPIQEVVWLVLDGPSNFNPPFGRVIHIENEEQ